MRSEKEVQAAVELLRLTGEEISKAVEGKSLTADKGKEMKAVVDSTMNVYNWVLGGDVDTFTSTPIADEVIKVAKGVDLFKDLS